MSLFNKFVVASLPIVPKGIVKRVAQRYIAGPSLSDAIRTTQNLHTIGATATIDVLGEFTETRERATSETEMSRQVIEAIHQHRLQAYLSVKLTSIGLDVDRDFAFNNLRSLLDRAAELDVFVRMDMENTPYTSITLEFYRRLRELGYNNLGIVIQAYLRRSENDVKELLDFQPDVRLCKGIYVEAEDVAFKNPEEIRGSYKHLLRMLIDGGSKVRIATHDSALIADAEHLIAQKSLTSEQYQFQMLMGVREDERDRLLAAAHPVCIYVPFGEDWYGYSTRRLKENPQIAGYVARAVLTGRT